MQDPRNATRRNPTRTTSCATINTRNGLRAKASLTTGYFQNEPPLTIPGESTEDRCGPYLARAMRERGYRTFGIGKFHTIPAEEDLGYDVYLRSEEMDGYPDAYSRFIWSHPAYKHIEQLHGERSNMHYHPQTSPLPQELTVERWAADQAVEQIRQLDDRPYFGLAESSQTGKEIANPEIDTLPKGFCAIALR